MTIDILDDANRQNDQVSCNVCFGVCICWMLTWYMSSSTELYVSFLFLLMDKDLTPALFTIIKTTDQHLLLIRVIPLLHLAPPLSLRRCQLCFTAVPCDCVYRDGRGRVLAGDEGLEEWTRADGAGSNTARGRILGFTKY